MTVDRALRALREGWALTVLCVSLGLLGAGVATYFAPRQYSSDVTLYVALQGPAQDSDDAFQANELAEERAGSYALLLTDERVTQPVIDRLGLPVSPAQLAEQITVTAESGTVVLSAAVRDSTPDGAAVIANALAAELVGVVQELEQPIGPAPPPPPPGQPAQEPPRLGVQTIRLAIPDGSPVSPDIPFNLALGAALGLLIGVAAVLVREARDTSVRSATQLHELASAPVLTEIAYDRRVPTRPLIIDDPFASPRAEAFRKLRTNVQFRGSGHGHRVIVVTSPRMGEGSSTTACNLAVALAEAGNRVLLVDANLRSPRVADYLGLEQFPGLVDVLAGRMVWPYARQLWNRGAFDVLTAGPVSQDYSQLLASYGLADLLEDMRRHYHFVVVDTPALLPVSDAAAVAARADGVVLVVQHRQTSQDQVAAAVNALDAVSARLLGTVLTMTRGRLHRKARVPTYRAPAARVKRFGPAEPAPAPNEGAGVLSEAAAPGNGARPESAIEPVPQQIESSEWRPSPNPRS